MAGPVLGTGEHRWTQQMRPPLSRGPPSGHGMEINGTERPRPWGRVLSATGKNQAGLERMALTEVCLVASSQSGPARVARQSGWGGVGLDQGASEVRWGPSMSRRGLRTFPKGLAFPWSGLRSRWGRGPGHSAGARQQGPGPWRGQSRVSRGVSQEESGSEQCASSGGVRSRQSRGAGRGV